MQVGTNRQRSVGIDGALPFLDVLDQAVFVDDNVSSLRPMVRLVLQVVDLQDAIFSEHLLVHVAEQRKFDIDLLGKGGVGRGTVHTYAKNFRVGGVDFSCAYSRLDRLELLGSTTGEGQNVNGQKDVFLPAKVA